jgi:hypothetical protein
MNFVLDLATVFNFFMNVVFVVNIIPEYLSFATISKDLLAVFMLRVCPASHQ